MLSWFKSRIHESLAVAALFATAVSLHAAWIANLVWFRLARIDTMLPLYVLVDTVFAGSTVINDNRFYLRELLQLFDNLKTIASSFALVMVGFVGHKL